MPAITTKASIKIEIKNPPINAIPVANMTKATPNNVKARVRFMTQQLSTACEAFNFTFSQVSSFSEKLKEKPQACLQFPFDQIFQRLAFAHERCGVAFDQKLGGQRA